MTKINGSISKNLIEFQSGAAPPSFQVYVTNQSDLFASFRVELIAAGADPSIGHRWYQLKPEVSAVKPPGDKTEFTVIIIDTPIPGLDNINVTVQISSLEFRDIFRLSLRLKINPRTTLDRFEIDLPVKNYALYPREEIEIPLRVTNLETKDADILLEFTGIEPDWLNRGAERRLLVAAGRQAETSFSCQPPIAVRAPSKKYPFRIRAYLQGKFIGSADGTIEVLPVGTVFTSVGSKEHWLPTKNYWFLNWRSNPVSYLLKFKNSSNLFQTISIEIPNNKNIKKLKIEPLPEQVNAAPGENLPIELKVSKKRPWFGLIQKFTIDAFTRLSDERLGKADPPSHQLKLNIHPIVPLWLQLLLSLLILILLFLLLSGQAGHQLQVNSVSFTGVNVNGQLNPIVSGSEDRTVRSWQATPDNLLCKFFDWQKFCLKANKHPILNDEQTDQKAVAVLRYRAEQTDRLGVGLENGHILLWDVEWDLDRGQKIDSLVVEKGDRVFALAFSKNYPYLFSGHGGQLWQWDLTNQKPKDFLFENNNTQEVKRFAISTLALSQDERILIIAGRFNKIFLGIWDGENQLPKFEPLQSYPVGSTGDYIESIATAENILVTSDIQGSIRIWDLNECSKKPDCKSKDDWQIVYPSGDPMPVRTVALTQNGRYLVISGDDGIIRLWQMNTEKIQRQNKSNNGQEIANYSETGINDIDVITRENRLLIVSGADDHKVRLNTYNINSDR